ncbi:MAG: hypothetical protein L0Y71_13515 [Gemmataceae bacterium]|nr:hypothetical protein [Gemmataceae bacterium]
MPTIRWPVRAFIDFAPNTQRGLAAAKSVIQMSHKGHQEHKAKIPISFLRALGALCGQITYLRSRRRLRCQQRGGTPPGLIGDFRHSSGRMPSFPGTFVTIPSAGLAGIQVIDTPARGS